ncbi:hypothetical protein F5Y16DRAFT_423983 [Xylariaceae sp. FL0255]|nr:hypothetical protein F5Y16DRAFT_423983 [Xylariaceae sp. FL0255]
MGFLRQVKLTGAYLAPIASLLVAGALAEGHHLFYQYLPGNAPPENQLEFAGLIVSGQQINTSIGVFLAILMKTFLNIAVGNAPLKCSEISRNDTMWKNVSATIARASSSNYFAEEYTDGIANIQYLAWSGAPTDGPWSGDGGTYSFEGQAYEPNGSPLSLTVVAFLESADSTDGENFTYVEGVQSVASGILSYDTTVDGSVNTASPCDACDKQAEEWTTYEEDISSWQYMAVLHASQTYVVGSVIEEIYDLDTDTKIDTQIGLTVLPFTTDLSYIQDSITGLNGEMGFTTGGHVITNHLSPIECDPVRDHPVGVGLENCSFAVDGISGKRNLSVGDALEGMFRNLTISLASEPSLQQINTPKNTNVSAYTYHNIYAYTPSLLWLIYGIALGTSALSVISGCIAIGLAKGCYSTKFFTILRVSHNVRLGAGIIPSETTGKDPLPSRLEKTLVYFSPDGVSALIEEKTDSIHSPEEEQDSEGDG